MATTAERLGLDFGDLEGVGLSHGHFDHAGGFPGLTRHAGLINILRHATRLTGIDRIHAVIGGFHLGGPAFEAVMPPTVADLIEMAPDLVVPGHCTGGGPSTPSPPPPRRLGPEQRRHLGTISRRLSAPRPWAFPRELTISSGARRRVGRRLSWAMSNRGRN